MTLPSARPLNAPDTKTHAEEGRVTWLASSPGLQLALRLFPSFGSYTSGGSPAENSRREQRLVLSECSCLWAGPISPLQEFLVKERNSVLQGVNVKLVMAHPCYGILLGSKKK